MYNRATAVEMNHEGRHPGDEFRFVRRTINGNMAVSGEKLVSRRKAITLGRYRNCYEEKLSRREEYRRMTLIVADPSVLVSSV